MDLFIKVDEANVPQGFPRLKSNLKQAYPALDFNAATPPSGWLRYRKQLPNIGPYNKFDDSIGADLCQAAYGHNGLERKLVDGEIVEVWHYEPISNEEKQKKIDLEKAVWEALDPPGPASWVFDEPSCEYIAPIPYPSDGKEYCWNESLKIWQAAEGITDFRLVHGSMNQQIVRKIRNS